MDLSHFTGPIEASARWGMDSGIAIIGGLGEMGRLFTRFFESHGFTVAIADVNTPLTPEQAVRESDIVVFSVPLHETVGIIQKLAPLFRKGQLVLDLTSLKVAPVREMLTTPAFVVGMHPMFGGHISNFSGQTLAACPVRIDPADWAWLRDLFTASGIRVKECSPEEHDRMMSIIQVLFHLTTMLIGRTLRRLGIDIGETMEYTSPSYRIEMNLVGRIFAQSPELYAAITQMNPNSSSIFKALREGLDLYEDFYKSEDLEGFMEDFKRSAQHLGTFCRSAHKESSELLDFSVELAKRNEFEHHYRDSGRKPAISRSGNEM